MNDAAVGSDGPGPSVDCPDKGEALLWSGKAARPSRRRCYAAAETGTVLHRVGVAVVVSSGLGTATFKGLLTDIEWQSSGSNITE
jgi:hypothetical protein